MPEHTVKVGDTLQSISSEHYGHPHWWQRIYHANEQRIKTPESLTPGTRLTIPQ